ncbi:MAG TPA: ketol-acid reductoisomerase, partial [Chloroflexi bacterium]|nr:ketol-acid reductoisomerase [Chloroflexota bacterium]
MGLPEGSTSRAAAREDGFEVAGTEQVSSWAELIAVLVPDQLQGAVFHAAIEPQLRSGKSLVFAHGFSLRYGQIVPPSDVDVLLVAPVGPGQMLRRLFLEGFGIPAVWAVRQDASGSAEGLALSYAAALGCTRAGVVHSTIEEETETDLFGEQ